MNAKLSTKYTITKIPDIEISPQMIKKPQPKIEKLSEVINNNNENDIAETDDILKSNITNTKVNDVTKPQIHFDFKLSLFLINSNLKDYKKTAKRLDDYNYRRYNDNFWKSTYNKPFNKLLINCIIGERLVQLPVVQISSYICKILVLPNSEPIIIYLPCMVHTNTIKSSVRLVSVLRTKLTITVEIDYRPLSSVDIGSRQSVLAEALETDKDYNTSTKTNINTNQEKNITTQSDRSKETAVSNDEELPEDKFHKKDATSSYIINQRDDQHKQKQTERDSERELHQNKEKDPDNDVEYIDVEKWKKDNNKAKQPPPPPEIRGRVCPALVEMKELLKMSSSVWTELD